MSQTFIGFVDDRGKLALDHQEQFRAFVARKFKGCEVEVEVRERRTKRSHRQNAGYHAMLTPWARDEGHQIDELKRQLLAHVFGTKEIPNAITGVVELVPVKPHTSELTVQEFSELIEQTLIIAAECGYVLMAPDEWKQAHPERYPVRDKTRNVA